MMNHITVFALAVICSLGLSAGNASADGKGKKKGHKIENPGKKKGHDKKKGEWEKKKDKEWDDRKKDFDKDLDDAKKDLERDVKREIRKEILD